MKNHDKVKLENQGKNVVISKVEQSDETMSFKNLLERFYQMHTIPTQESVTRRQRFEKNNNRPSH